MQAKVVLEHLQGMFPGRLVLYAPDMARVLGLSERALAHLIERGRFPFPVKTIGRRRCVDIFKVAEWLASNGDMPDSRAFDEGQPSKPAPKNSAARAQTSAGQSTIAKRMIEMRHRMSSGIAQMASSVHDSIERVFWSEVAEALAMQPHFGGVAVKLRWSRPAKDGSSAGEQTTYFDTASDGIAFARKAQEDLSSCNEASIVIRVGDRKIYQCLKIDRWHVAVDLRESYLKNGAPN